MVPHTSPHNLAKLFNVHEISAFCCDMFTTERQKAQHAESSSSRIVSSWTYRYLVVRSVRGHTWNIRESCKLIVSASYRHRIVCGVQSEISRNACSWAVTSINTVPKMSLHLLRSRTFQNCWNRRNKATAHVLLWRPSAHERLESQRVFHRWNERFCFKWKRAHGRLFHRSVFPDATCFIFYAVRWPHSGWRWQWNTKEHTCLRARAAKQTHGHQSSSAVPSKCTNHGYRLQDFW